MAEKPNAMTLIQKVFEDRKDKLAGLLPKHLTPERLTAVALSCIGKTEKLQQCTAASLYNALRIAAEVGLEPGSALGHLYLVPYGAECTPIIGFKGYVELMWRTGLYKSLDVDVVYEGDEFRRVKGFKPVFKHVPAVDENGRGKIIGAYFLAEFVAGGKQVTWMSISDIHKIRDRSKAAKSGPWVTDYEEMVKKTVIRRATKLLPLSSEKVDASQRLTRAIELDDSDYVDGELAAPSSPALPSDTQVAAEVVKPGNARARAAIAKPMQIVDVPEEAATEPGAAG